MNGFLIFLICIAITALMIASKRFSFACFLLLIPLGVLVYLVMGKATFFLCAVSLAVYYLFALLLRIFSLSAYNLIYRDKSPLPSLFAHTGLLFCEIFVLVLSISTYEGMFTDYGFLRLAFYTTLATSSALALSGCVNGFASVGFNIMTNKKTLPFESGSVTVIGAVSAFFACFATSLIYFFISRSAVQASLTCLLSFIGYISNAMICAKFQTRTFKACPAPSDAEAVENEQVEEEIETIETIETIENQPNSDGNDDKSQVAEPLQATDKTDDKTQSNALTLTFVSILISTVIAVIIGFIIK